MGSQALPSKRDRYWPEVEQYFGSLPPLLFQQGVLLKHNLATRYSDTGQFKDILARPQDHPLLELPGWLLADWQIPQTPARTDLEKHLFLAAVFSLAATHLYETLPDQESLYDPAYLVLAQTLTTEATAHLARLFPGDSPFWSYHQACWLDYAQARARNLQPGVEMLWRGDPTDLPHLAQPLAPAKIPAAAVAIHTGQTASLPDLFAMLDHLHAVLQVYHDILAIRYDLSRGHYTYPLIRTMQAAGIDWRQPVVPERVLGALILTGSIQQLCQDCLAWLETGRTLSQALNLFSLTSYWHGLEKIIRDLQRLFTLKAKPAQPAGVPPTQFFFRPAIDTFNQVIEMAEGYLLADLTFRESWEVQRQGLFNQPQLTGRIFPAGLIVELLCRQGQPLAAQVNQLFDLLQATGFSYYDPPVVPPDADVLGLALRLYPYSPQPALHQKVLQTPLQWLKENVLATGEIPVWLTKQQQISPSAGTDLAPTVLLWGCHCITVEANFLLGLLAYDPTGYAGLIQNSALHLFDRLSSEGLGAAQHYAPLYSLWTLFELLAQLSGQHFERLLPEKLAQIYELLAERLKLEANRHLVTPQDAAFLTLACLAYERAGHDENSAGRQSPVAGHASSPLPSVSFDSSWLTILTKTQRYDGSWQGEPLYVCPHRGGAATWYASRPVTTAFCYYALWSYQQSQS